MIKKIKEIEFKYDIWFLTTIKDKIIINDYSTGIAIYNKHFDLIKKFFITKHITIYPYLLYINNNEILLHCYENMKLVYINANDFKCKIIDIPKNMKKINFSKAYEWYENKIILSSYCSQFFEVNLNKCTIKEINTNYVKKCYSNFYNLYKIYTSFIYKGNSITIFKDFNILVIYQKNKQYNLNIVKCYNNNYISNEIHIDIDINFYNIIYEKNILAAIDENEIEIITEKSKEKLLLQKEYMYCGASFFRKNNEMFLIVALTSKSCLEDSKLILYKIE